MHLDRRRLLRLTAMLALAVVAAAPTWAQTASMGKTEVLWLAQSAARITTPGGKVIVTDPWITTNPKTPAEWKDLDKLGKVDIILISHGHGDHIGDVTALQQKTGAMVYGPAGLVQTLIDLGRLPADKSVRFGYGGTVTPPGTQIKITQVHAEHSSEVTIPDPETKKTHTYPGGEPCGFIIEMENGFKIYHMGDTGLFSDMQFIAKYYKPDLVMMPIGGHYVMNPKDAAYATKMWLKPKYVLPMHYGTNPYLVGTPAEYQAALGKTSTKVFPIDPGETLKF